MNEEIRRPPEQGPPSELGDRNRDVQQDQLPSERCSPRSGREEDGAHTHRSGRRGCGMTAQSVRASGPRDLLGRAWSSSRPLAFVGATMLLVLVVSLAGLLLDPRVITGAPAWLKPIKFAISISIYCFTLLWMLTFVRGRRRLVDLISWVTVVALFVEMALIAGAAALGTTSHYHVSTPRHHAARA